MSELKTAVGTTRNWKAEKAGKEVAREVLKKLGENPNFVLLFPTIHYEENGGFKKFLDGIWDVLPKDVTLVGGTVAGFINPKGCFTRGASALAVSFEEMDIALGIGEGTKKNPGNAAEECAKDIKNSLNESKYSEKIVFDFISGATIPKLPFIGKKNIVDSALSGSIITRFLLHISSFFGSGIGKEEDIVDSLKNKLPGYNIFGGTTVDEFKYLSNYQFANERVLTNSIVALGLCGNFTVNFKGEISGGATSKTFQITGTTFDDRVITEIEGEKARNYFYEKVLGISKSQFEKLDPFYYKMSNYFPIGFQEYSDYTTGVGGIYGNDLLLGYKAKGRNAYIISVTGNGIMNSLDNVLDAYDNNPFNFFSSSGIRLNILGRKGMKIKEKIDKKIKDGPYLVAYFTNENIGKGKDAVNRVYSCNLTSIGVNKCQRKSTK